MNSQHRSAAGVRLDAARGEESAASDDLDAAAGTAGEFHAAVQLRAAEDEVEARAAWLAWTDRGEEDL
jgi:hypothetical protein